VRSESILIDKRPSAGRQRILRERAGIDGGDNEKNRRNERSNPHQRAIGY
jgi:hypothetical protein